MISAAIVWEYRWRWVCHPEIMLVVAVALSLFFYGSPR